MSQTVIVIPAYNEAARIDLDEFCRFADAHSDISFLFVNDGSTDDTLVVLESLFRSHPHNMKLLDLAENRGKAEAVRRGVLHALEERPEYVGFLDADLATPLAEIPRLLGVLQQKENMDLAIGVRLPLAGHVIHRKPMRRWLGLCFASAASLALGLRVTDTQCGAKLFRASQLTQSLFTRRFISKWLFDVELLARYLIACGKSSSRTRFYELPLNEWNEIPGSKLKALDFIQAPRELVSIYLHYFLRKNWDYQSAALPVSTTTPTTAEPAVSENGSNPRKAA